MTRVGKTNLNEGGCGMKKAGMIMAVFVALALFSACAHTEKSGNRGSFEGSIQGFNCVTQGKVCPVGREDPMIGAENVFVLVTEGNKFYFVSNLDRGIMARHFNKMVKIEGIKSDQFNSIKADGLYVQENGRWRKTWSQNWQDEIYNEIMLGNPLGGA
jgi:hypothetical protein